MLENSDSHPDELLSAAQMYHHLGYSVLPLRGDADPNQPKVPAIAWQNYQHRRAGESEFRHWFPRHSAIGIVTGRISALAVLDFDDPALYEAFAAQYPHLTETRTIQTARGFHLYFCIPQHLAVKTRKAARVDWLFDGCYVVAPPSTIQGHTYRVLRGGMPLTLTATDLPCLDGFLASLQVKPADIQLPLPPEPLELKTDTPLSGIELVALYRSLAAQGSRNTALFNAFLTARDSGWSRADTGQLLLDIFIHDRRPDDDLPEQRRREGLATLASAFSRPPRPRRERVIPMTTISTGLVEAFHQRKQTAVLRTLVALRLRGIRPGEWFSRPQAKTLLHGYVGAHSLERTLASITSTGTKLLEHNPASPPPSPPAYAALYKQQDTPLKCVEVCLSKSESNRKRGRTTEYFQMPSDTELAEKLGQPLSLSRVQFTLDDLSSARTTRIKTHRSLFERRPNDYSSRWLALRLGVSITSKCRYDKAIPDLLKQPMYTGQRLNWKNLKLIPPQKYELGQFFLMDGNSKKYPAVEAIARKLLKQNIPVSLMAQTWNRYSMQSTADRLAVEPLPGNSPAARMLPAMPVLSVTVREIKQPNPIYITLPEQKLVKVSFKSLAKKQKPSSVKKPHPARRSFSDEALEARTQALYRQLQNFHEGCITLRTIRRLVDQYGSAQVETAVKHLLKRPHVSSLAGLLTTMLRSKIHQDA